LNLLSVDRVDEDSRGMLRVEQVPVDDYALDGEGKLEDTVTYFSRQSEKGRVTPVVQKAVVC
jgi:hypothetical protein